MGARSSQAAQASQARRIKTGNWADFIADRLRKRGLDPETASDREWIAEHESLQADLRWIIDGVRSLPTATRPTRSRAPRKILRLIESHESESDV